MSKPDLNLTSAGAFSGYEWLLAGRYLRAKRREGAVSVIAGFSLAGIALGVATLIIVMSVMNGLRMDLLGRILGVNGHARIEAAAGPFLDFDAVMAQVANLPGIVRAMPLIERTAFASAQGQAGGTGVKVRGLRAQDLEKLAFIAANIRQGNLAAFGNVEDQGAEPVIIARPLAAQLSVSVGDRLTLISASGGTKDQGVRPRIGSFAVVAVVDPTIGEAGSTLYLPLEVAQSYFKTGGAVDAIDLRVLDPDRIDDVRPVLAKAIGLNHVLVDWRQQNATTFQALQIERAVMFLILTLIIVVAALNIVSGLIMLVKDKGRDIAILRTMGASRGAVMRVFLIAGASIGVSGTALGLLIGILVCSRFDSIRSGLSSLSRTDLASPELTFLSRMPVHMEWSEVTAIGLMALTLSLLATLYPSWRAAKLDPIEALRYE